MSAPRRLIVTSQPAAPAKNKGGRPKGSDNSTGRLTRAAVAREANGWLPLLKAMRLGVRDKLAHLAHEAEEYGEGFLPPRELLEAVRVATAGVERMGALVKAFEAKTLEQLGQMSDADLQQALRDAVASLPLDELEALVAERRTAESETALDEALGPEAEAQ